MAITQISVVYSSAQQVVRRIIDHRIVPDAKGNPRVLSQAEQDALDQNALDEIHKATLQPGEAWAQIPFASYDAIKSPQDLHTALNLTGIPGVTDRCIVYSNNSVVALCNADPSIDVHPSGTIAFDTTGKASVGYQVTNGTAVIPVDVVGPNLHPAQQSVT